MLEFGSNNVRIQSQRSAYNSNLNSNLYIDTDDEKFNSRKQSRHDSYRGALPYTRSDVK